MVNERLVLLVLVNAGCDTNENACESCKYPSQEKKAQTKLTLQYCENTAIVRAIDDDLKVWPINSEEKDADQNVVCDSATSV